MKLSICTPTFNRSDTLPRVYTSLCRQTNKNFEWLVIDDGSSDNTDNVILNIEKNNKEFGIKYIKKQNGGKHTAVNMAVKVAKGEIFLILDSDDYLVDEAVNIIMEAFSNLPKNGYAGCGFNRVFQNGSLVGGTFHKKSIDITSLEREKFGIKGDKAEVFFTHVLRKYPFPVFKNEVFLTEAIVWNRIANDGYLIRWINKGIYVCEYRLDGLSMSSTINRGFSGYTLFIKELMSYESTLIKEKIKWAGVYSYIAHQKGYSYGEIAKMIDTNIIFVFFSGNLYKVAKSKRKNNARSQQLKIENKTNEKK